MNKFSLIVFSLVVGLCSPLFAIERIIYDFSACGVEDQGGGYSYYRVRIIQDNEDIIAIISKNLYGATGPELVYSQNEETLKISEKGRLVAVTKFDKVEYSTELQSTTLGCLK